jgi:protein phosphatase
VAGSGSAEISVVITLFGKTDVGLMRSSNEDSFAIGDLDGDRTLDPDEAAAIEVGDRGPVLVVCDGMGGAAAGEVASGIAVEVVIAEMKQAPVAADRAVFARHLRRGVRTANRRVFDEGNRNWKLKGMGTTLSAAGIVGKELIVAQVGDSRAYVLRGSTLVQVTRDQSVVSALLHAGRITEREAESFSQANVILQALGVQEDVDVAISLVELRRGDRLLMCSDGLHGSVDDDELREILTDHDEPRSAASALIDRARDAGGPDNITAIVADYTGDGLDVPASEDDLPKFIEFDPQEEGVRAITTTSRVAHRLAARAGVGDDPGPRPIPATGQHAVIGDEGPAASALAERARIGIATWILAAVAVAAIVVLLLWRA